MPAVTDQAVCVRVWDWSETSQTVSLFSREHGMVRCVAKGSKREKSAYSGGLELLTRGEMLASIKHAGQLSLLMAWDLQEVFPAARQSLGSFHAGMLLLDTVRHCVTELDPHPPLFDELLAGMRSLGTPAGDRAAVLRVLWASLSATGHRPELFRDLTTGGQLPDAPVLALSTAVGGLVPDTARPTGPGKSWRVRTETVAALRALATRGGDAASDAPPEAAERGARLLAVYFREVFGVEPPTFKRLLGDER